MAAGAVCRTCGTEALEHARFCHECGAALTAADTHAEYKQVTVLFADVVHSMDIAAALGAERLREIMTELVDRASIAVRRFGGTVDKFTGDGIMAVFGAPVALEDHAVRGCLAALGIQAETARLAAEVKARDGAVLQLRVGLSSGQVIAGEIGSVALGYTAIGEQVGMAQRMESAAPPGGVMLSGSTVRLVEDATTLGESELVQIKGAKGPVRARRLLGMREGHRPAGRPESKLIDRQWELSAVGDLLERAVAGNGTVVTVVGSPGIGKSRLAREVTALAAARGMDAFTAHCESHANDVPFYTVARLLRVAIGVSELDGPAARSQVQARMPGADPEDLLLVYDLLGIADAGVELPLIDPDARRRRLTALVNAASLTRKAPSVYVIEDVHWIDEVSESMLVDFLTVIPQTPSLVIITYRPEYRAALSRVSGAQTLALEPLSGPETAALVSHLLGPDPSVGGLATMITKQAAGNPFFAEEMVRELAERGVLHGSRGAYVSTAQVAEVSVPATLQATIAARIDRLDPRAKHTLSAAAVIGSRFSQPLLETLGVDPALEGLVIGGMIDRIRFTRQREYVFHHPLIRAVAYESQLKSDRAELHRRVASAIQAREPESVDQNAAAIAEHLESAGDLYAAYDWHMRAATWASARDIAAAQTSWRRAREVADRIPADHPDRMSVRIAPRTMLCGTAWRITSADTGFDELRDLCTAAGDQRSLAIGMAGLVIAHYMNAQRREASRLAGELAELLESIADPTLTVALAFPAMLAKYETGEMADVLRLAQLVVELAEGDPARGNLVFPSPLTFAIGMRGVARCFLGIPGWKSDFDEALAMAHERLGDPTILAGVMWFTHPHGIAAGVLLPSATAVRDTSEFLSVAEKFGDNLALEIAQIVRGIVLLHQGGKHREPGLALLERVRERLLTERFGLIGLPIMEIHIARDRAKLGDLDGAIESANAVVDNLSASNGSIWDALAIAVLVEALLKRAGDGDLEAARTAIERLAVIQADPGLVLHEVWLLRLRSLLAQANGDAAAYKHFRDRYRDIAARLEFEGHIAWAEAMP
ncbi:adenylate/guanylate cyclase domain-containing protein [Mycobacterium sp. IS-1264]|uniref:AAA family ATPase n=1 Tax=Mycobacterium sp. IS-1264 TaxID=1834158 RepID=UPI00096C2CC3|nr:adenylate/guanylate cyclase domain-containing protein [Mycobacterium sp. IS-1264]OMC40068.1 cyclase [Mycobacterium sp. IS-1264]